ncbi:hypothetical protein G6F63_016722 [Rhizopus arrhizus]|nr:hypothetical protein G6F68_021415 [Rhizopus microsporus]KAG1302722.1 hypothetical protein G6F63_016722 [Rhizopus arrhizus]
MNVEPCDVAHFDQSLGRHAQLFGGRVLPINRGADAGNCVRRVDVQVQVTRAVANAPCCEIVETHAHGRTGT